MLDGRGDGLDMAAGGNLRYYAAVLSVQIHTASHHVRKQLIAILDHCGCRLVTTRLNAQNLHYIQDTMPIDGLCCVNSKIVTKLLTKHKLFATISVSKHKTKTIFR